MADLWRKTLIYLGLVEEPEELDDQDHEPEPDAAPRRRREPAAVDTRRDPSRERVREPEPLRSSRREEPANVRPLHRDTHVRPLEGGYARVHLVRAVTFDDAELVGERFRTGQPVLLDLGEVDTKVGRRLLDFVAGTTFALRGRIAPAGQRAFLLIPDGTEIPFEERRRLGDLGYQLQLTATQGEG